jgi:ketosteroid isomerase-like protein
MLTENGVRKLAREMMEAWNARDLERILEHYDEDVTLTSPVAAKWLGDASGTLRGKARLREYFAFALETHPELHFELVDVMWGVASAVLYYVNQRGTMTGEVLEIAPSGRVSRVLANYGTAGRPK